MLTTKKKLSGNQSRKRRMRQLEEDAIQGKQITKFLKSNVDPQYSCNNNTQNPSSTVILNSEIFSSISLPLTTNSCSQADSNDSLTAVCYNSHRLSNLNNPDPTLSNKTSDNSQLDLQLNTGFKPVSVETPNTPNTSQYQSPINESVEINQLCSLSLTTQHNVGQILNTGIGLNNISTSDMSDPSDWPLITDNFRQMIVQKGPVQIVEFNFPITNRRKFNTKHYYRDLSNGGRILRNWLIYSVSKNSVFCFCCKLFANASNHSLCNFGYSDWNHLPRLLKEHEISEMHNKSFTNWKLLELGLEKNRTIDSHVQKQLNQEISHWKDVLKRLFILVQFLGCQSLAFRGSSDVLFTENNGNFLKLIEAISKIDSVLAEHIRRIQNKETRYHYLSKNIQNEIISIMSTAVQKKMIAMIKTAKYYSIIVDSTPDASRTEQITLIVRFVHHNEESNNFEVREHFLGFIEGRDKTGEGFYETILNVLQNIDLSIQNCRGQGYDNAANMKGRHSGMQSRIKNIEPRAFFVPCSAHSLNLVVNDSADAKCSLEASKFFDDVQCLYVFFSKSTKRWDILKANVSSLTLKPLSTTRWSSRIDALRPLKDNLGDIYEALFQAGEEGDSATKVMATALGNKIFEFKFIFILFVWYDILENINIASKTLQSIDINISIAVKIVESTLDSLNRMRNEKCFDEYIDRAQQLASNLDISTEICSETALRSRRKKSLFEYETTDTTLTPKQQLKINFFYMVLDQAILSITERFTQLKNHFVMLFCFYMTSQRYLN